MEVDYDDKRVKYRSLAQMQELLASMEASLGTADPRRRMHNPKYRSGLEVVE